MHGFYLDKAEKTIRFDKESRSVLQCFTARPAGFFNSTDCFDCEINREKSV